jgi:hypothetical protein
MLYYIISYSKFSFLMGVDMVIYHALICVKDFLKAIEQSQKAEKFKSLTHKYTPSLFPGLLRALQYKKKVARLN